MQWIGDRDPTLMAVIPSAKPQRGSVRVVLVSGPVS